MRIHNYSDDYDADTLCDIFECLDCPRYADDCDGDPDNMIEDEEL